MMLFWILVLLALFPGVTVEAPAPIPVKLTLTEVVGRLMVLFEIVLKSVAFSNCTPQQKAVAAGVVITKLFSFTNFAPFSTKIPGFEPGTGVAETVLPEPSKVTVLVALVK